MAQKLSKRKTGKILVSKNEHIKTSTREITHPFGHQRDKNKKLIDLDKTSTKEFIINKSNEYKNFKFINFTRIPNSNNFLFRAWYRGDNVSNNKSYNVIVNGNGDIVGRIKEMDPIKVGRYYIDYEDTRICIGKDNKKYYITNNYKTNGDNGITILEELTDGTIKKIKENIKFKQKTEKNWSMFQNTDLIFVYDYRPFAIIKLGDKIETISTKHNLLNGWRGSSIFKEYENGYIGLIHKRLGLNEYIHKFIKFDFEFNLIGQSSAFYFEQHNGIEFCIDFDITDDTIIFYYQLNDCTPKIMKVNKEVFKAEMFNNE